MRLLLVDDHELVRGALRVLLERAEDMTVVGEACEGLEATTLAKQLSPDVILMDVVMPKMDGIEATSRIRRTLPETAVLMLSAHSDRQRIVDSLRAGASGFLSKSAPSEHLFVALRDVAAGRRHLSPEAAAEVLDDVFGVRNAAPGIEKLSPRERTVLALMVSSKRSAQIAEELHISVQTVHTHRKRIRAKLCIHRTADLVKLALRHGLV